MLKNFALTSRHTLSSCLPITLFDKYSRVLTLPDKWSSGQYIRWVWHLLPTKASREGSHSCRFHHWIHIFCWHFSYTRGIGFFNLEGSEIITNLRSMDFVCCWLVQPTRLWSRIGPYYARPTNRVTMEYVLHFKFKSSNNKAEYEALLESLRLAKHLGIK